MALKKIKLPDNSVVEVQDSRIPAPQSTDNGKVLGVTSAAGAMGWVEQGGYDIVIKCTNENGFTSVASDYVTELGSFFDVVEKAKSGKSVSGIAYVEKKSYDDEEDYWSCQTIVLKLSDVSFSDYGVGYEARMEFRKDFVGKSQKNILTGGSYILSVSGNDDPDLARTYSYVEQLPTATPYVKPSTGIPVSDIASTSIDSSPTDNSTNLVTSGGVYDAISSIPASSGSKIYVGTCATAAATVNKEVSVEQFPMDENQHPLVGTTIAFKSTYTNSATAPKLNVNDTGAASVWYSTAAVTNANTYVTQAGVYCFYVWDGTYWVWINFGKELNDNTLAYQVRSNSSTRYTTDAFVRYRLLFSSADDSKWVPANTSTSTNSTAARAVNQRPINPFGAIVFYNSTTAIGATGVPGVTTLHVRNNGFALGYSFNRTGSSLTLSLSKPVYVVCKPATDGSAIIDGDTPFSQVLPTSEDGKIYIFIGIAYSTTNIELYETHPVYWYKDGAIRLYTNSNANTQKEEDENISGYLSRAIGSNESWTETLATGTMAEGYIYGADGTIASTSDYWNYYTIPLGTAKKVRFNGFAPNEPPSSSDAWSGGYAFYDSNDNCVASANWAIDTSLPAHTEKEFIVNVPTGATTLRVTNAKDDAYYCYTKKRPFYCYLMEGKTISEMSVQAVNTCNKIWAGTQAQYDLLTPDSDTLYLITGQ